MRLFDMMTDADLERLNEENKKLKKRAEEAEGENTIIKGIGLNSPEMKALQKEVERIQWDARERITPIRNNKNDEPEEH